jgi:hypothetical protein
MTGHLRGLDLPFSFVDAADGRTLPDDQIASLQPSPLPCFRILRSEIALAATLRALCEQIAGGSDPFVCILEDDARLGPAALPFLRDGALAHLPRFDVLRLGHGGIRFRRGYRRVGSLEGEDVLAPVQHSDGAFGLIVSREGARSIAAGLVPLKAAVDTHLFGYGWVALRILDTSRPLIDPGTQESVMQADAAEAPMDFSDSARAARRRSDKEANARGKRRYRQAWGWRAYVQARAAGFMAGMSRRP